MKNLEQNQKMNKFFVLIKTTFFFTFLKLSSMKKLLRIFNSGQGNDSNTIEDVDTGSPVVQSVEKEEYEKIKLELEALKRNYINLCSTYSDLKDEMLNSSALNIEYLQQINIQKQMNVSRLSELKILKMAKTSIECGKDETIESLNEKYTGLIALYENLKDNNKKNGDLNALLKTQITTLTTKISSLDKKNAKKVKIIERLRESQRDVDQKVSSKEYEIMQEQTTHIQLKKTHKKTKEFLTETLKQKSILEEQIRNYGSNFSLLEAELTMVKRKFTEGEADFTRESRENIEMRKKVVNINNENNAMKQEIKRLGTDLAIITSEKKHLCKEFGENMTKLKKELDKKTEDYVEIVGSYEKFVNEQKETLENMEKIN